MSNPLVTVITPTRNRLAFLKEAVGSLQAQSFQSWETVVVDDASDDGTFQWASGLANPRVRPVRYEKHVERAVARNRGLREARGEFVLFLDDDDRLTPETFTILHALLMKHPHAIAATGASVLFDKKENRRRLPSVRKPVTRMMWKELLAGWMTPPSGVLWRKEVVERAGGWDERIVHSGDQELWLRAARHGPVAFTPKVIMEKRTHAGQIRAGDVRQVRDRWLGEYVEKLPPADKRLGSRLLKAYALRIDADKAYGARKPRQAALSNYKAILTAPTLVTSPLMRSVVIGSTLKSTAALLVGEKGMDAAGRARGRIRSVRGANVEEVKLKTGEVSAWRGEDVQPLAPRIRLLTSSRWRNYKDNPYNFLLYQTLIPLGVEVEDYSTPRAMSGKFDIWHLHWPDSALAGRNPLKVAWRCARQLLIISGSRRRGTKLIWTAHNLGPHEHLHPLLERLFMSAFVKRVDGAIALTRAGKLALLKRFPRLEDVPLAVAPIGHFDDTYSVQEGRRQTRSKLNIPENGTVFLFFGQIRPYKNVVALLDAFRGVKDPDSFLLISGEPRTGDLEREVREAAARDSRVRLDLSFVHPDGVGFGCASFHRAIQFWEPDAFAVPVPPGPRSVLPDV